MGLAALPLTADSAARPAPWPAEAAESPDSEAKEGADMVVVLVLCVCVCVCWLHKALTTSNETLGKTKLAETRAEGGTGS